MLYHLTLAVVQTPLAAKRLSSWISRTNTTYSGRTFRLIGTSKWIYCSSSRWAARCSLNLKVSALDGLFIATPEKNPTLHQKVQAHRNTIWAQTDIFSNYFKQTTLSSSPGSMGVQPKISENLRTVSTEIPPMIRGHYIKSEMSYHCFISVIIY